MAGLYDFDLDAQVVDDRAIGWDDPDNAGGTSLALSPATVTVTGVAPARTAGGASRAVSPATVTVTPAAPSRSVGGTSPALSPAAVTVTPVAPARTVGGTTRAVTPASIAVTPVALARAAARAAGLSPATITVTPPGFAIVVGYDPEDLMVTIVGSTATLDWDASATPGVSTYDIFRRTPSTGDPFDPHADTPVAVGVGALTYDDTGLAAADYDWQVFGVVN